MAHRLTRDLYDNNREVFSTERIRIKMNSASGRNYVSEMRKGAFEGNILRLLRNEIQYELDRSPMPPSELDDVLQDSLYEFLERRGINDLAVFLHQYMKNKDKTEFIHWMETVKSFIEGKQRK